MNVKKLEQAHRYRLELILVGMALAKPDARQRIVTALSADDFGNQRLQIIRRGIEERDVDAVWLALSDMGVHEHGDVLESLLRRHAELRAEEQRRDIVSMVMTSNLLEEKYELIDRLREALRVCEEQND